MSPVLTIGQLSKATNCKIPTIRYYEEIGLLPHPARTAGQQRRYGNAHVARLEFIQHCRELGFRQKAIRELLRLTERPEESCEAVAEVARIHLEEVNQRMSQLSALRLELERMIAVCDGGQVADCRIIETLADHSHGHCVASDHFQ